MRVRANNKADESRAARGFLDAVRIQVRFIWRTRRPLWLLGGLIGVMLLAVMIRTPTARVLKFWPIWFLFVGPTWAFSVWHEESPSRRRYLWTQPVDRTQHTLARVGVGLGWLWVMFSLMVGLGVLVAIADGNVAQLSGVSFAGWVNLFVAVSAGYVVASWFTVALDEPLRWLLGLLLLPTLLLTLLNEQIGSVSSVVGKSFEVLALSEFGPLQAFFGPWVYEMASLAGSLRGRPSPPAEPAADWWIAWPIWMVVVCAILWIIARMHPDRLMRLRGRSVSGSQFPASASARAEPRAHVPG